MKIRNTVISLGIAGALAAGAGVYSVTASAQDAGYGWGMMGYGPRHSQGYGPGYGHMHGYARGDGQNYGPGYHMRGYGPGMMQGYGYGSDYGPGMMGDTGTG